jgi:imidazolonepropionase-like amidohydrolase
MRRIWSGTLLFFLALLCFAPKRAYAQSKPTIIAASTVLDGRGHILHDTRIVVQNGKIIRIDPKAGPVTYDLRGLTVLPGLIDAHVHITSHFNKDGRLAGADEPREESDLAIAANAWRTLMGGFTTVQSVGAPDDGPLRDAIARGWIPGPRILTAIRPLHGRGPATGTPEQIRKFIDEDKAMGANLIKIFANKSMRDGGGVSLSQEQLNAACDEARKDGLRSLVHAYGPAIHAAVLAGCTEIEHGIYGTDEDLKLMAEHHTWLDPQVGLVYYNYMDNKPHYIGIGNYTEAGFKAMKGLHRPIIDVFKRALRTPGLKIIFGTDATAGAEGHNSEELIYRVEDGGQSPMDALVCANSVTAESMGLGKQIGTIATGYDADIIALNGDPIKDITAVRNVVFVMKGGVVFKNVAPFVAPAPYPRTN